MDEYKLVEATKGDCQLLYRWTNEVEVRRNSFNTNKVSYEDHINWFMNKLNSKDTFIYIFKNKKESIGVIRLEKLECKSMLINYSIDSNYRSQGYATKLLQLIKIKFKDYTLVGEVKKNNIGSIKAFQKAGYFMKEELEYLVFYSKG
jgi:RimJ/RimL family protein N-acetyltransferase